MRALAFLVHQRSGWIGESNHFSRRKVFGTERRFGRNDSQYLAATNAPDRQTIAIDGNHPVLLFEDRFICLCHL